MNNNPYNLIGIGFACDKVIIEQLTERKTAINSIQFNPIIQFNSLFDPPLRPSLFPTNFVFFASAFCITSENGKMRHGTKYVKGA